MLVVELLTQQSWLVHWKFQLLLVLKLLLKMLKMAICLLLMV